MSMVVFVRAVSCCYFMDEFMLVVTVDIKVEAIGSRHSSQNGWDSATKIVRRSKETGQ